MRSKRLTLVFGVALCTMALTQCGGSSAPEESDAPQAMTPADAGDWPMYRHDLAATGYSPLAEITTSNVADLTAVWTYSLDAEESGGRGPSSQVTPIVVDGVMYLPAADRVVALDPDTGSELWRPPVAAGPPSRRGCSHSMQPPAHRSRASGRAAKPTWGCHTTRSRSSTGTS